MELYIYSGFGELPSIDFDCLRTAVSTHTHIGLIGPYVSPNSNPFTLQTFIKFNNAPVTIHTNGNPFKSPNGFLPYLKCEDGTLIGGYDEIVAHLKSQVCRSTEYIQLLFLTLLSLSTRSTPRATIRKRLVMNTVVMLI